MIHWSYEHIVYLALSCKVHNFLHGAVLPCDPIACYRNIGIYARVQVITGGLVAGVNTCFMNSGVFCKFVTNISEHI